MHLNLSEELTIITTSDDALNKTDSRVNMIYLLWPLLILVISSMLFREIYIYLNDQPTNKQCLLLYLYKDMLVLSVLSIWFLTSVMIWHKFIRKGTSADHHQAFIISMICTMIKTIVIIHLNIIYLLKWYILNTKLVDPLNTYFKCDDERAIRCIRYFHSGMALSIMAITFGTGSKFALYYHLEMIEFKFSSSVIVEVTCSNFLAITFLIGTIATNIIEKRQALRHDNYRITFEVETEDIRIFNNGQGDDVNNDCSNNYTTPSMYQITTALTKIAGPIKMCAGLVLLWFLIINSIAIITSKSNSYIYTSIAVIQFLLGVILPSLIVHGSSALSGAIKRRMFNAILFLLQPCKNLWSRFLWLRRSNMIQPVE